MAAELDLPGGPLDHVLGLLPDARATLPGQWRAKCPAHDDREPSLSIREGTDGRALLHCFAGCELEAILVALRLAPGDLFATQARPRPRPRAVGQPSTSPSARGKIVATYDYRTPGGELAYQVVRREPKMFRQRRPDGNGGWTWNLNGTERVLYRLPELLSADPAQPLFIVEGEKDVDRLRDLGLAATCNPGGAGKWRPEYAAILAGRFVVIVGDNDDPGREHAHRVKAALDEHATVRLLELPGLPDHGDVSDWLDAGGTSDELLRLANTVPDAGVGDVFPESELRTVTATEFLSEQGTPHRDGLVADLVPFVAGVAVLAGPRKSFKTLVALHMAIAIAGDRPGLLGRAVGRHGPVLIVLEEGSRDKLRERLAAMLAGLEIDAAPEGLHLALFSGLQVDVADSWERLRATVARIHPVLVVFDPLVYLHAGDENDNPHMSRVMRRFVALANDEELVVLVLHHLAKPGERKPARPSDRIRGAGAIAGAGDANLVMDRHGANGARLQAEYRDAEDLDLFLELEPGRLLLVETDAPDAARKVTREDVVAYVNAAAAPVGVSAAAKDWNVSRNTALSYLLEVAEGGRIDHYLDGPRNAHRFVALEAPVNAAD